MAVLILAGPVDPCADLMVRALAGHGADVLRMDTAWFPQYVSLTAQLTDGGWCGVLRTPGGVARLEEITAIWYRAPTLFRLPSGLTPAERAHVRTEARFGLGGVLLSLPIRWVNRPDRVATACYKPLQMVAATRAGLTVADTLITNAADAVPRFARPLTGVITKMFASSSIIEGGRRHVAFTRAVLPNDLDTGAIAATAHLFQEHLAKAFDARVVVIGDQQFGFAIHSDPASGHLDFRRDYSVLHYERVEVPVDVSSGITAVLRELGLSYAAIDFVVDQAGHWIFIGDVNPGGQYGFLEAATDAPLTATLAELLIQKACA